QRFAFVAADECEIANRANLKRCRQCRKDRQRDSDFALRLFRAERRHTVADMLLAEPNGVTSTEPGVEQYVQPHALFRPERPSLLVTFHLAGGPDRKAPILFLLRFFASGSWVHCDQLSLQGPTE